MGAGALLSQRHFKAIRLIFDNNFNSKIEFGECSKKHPPCLSSRQASDGIKTVKRWHVHITQPSTYDRNNQMKCVLPND